MQYGLIMAGGAGQRLWPLSRSNRPKQLLPVVEGRSLLRLSYERLGGLLPPERIFVATAAAHASAVLADLPELPRENLLGEPATRDTANAVGLSAALLLKRDPDAVVAVVGSDHVIEPVDRFCGALRTAFAVVAQQPQSLVTFGIIPTHGHTGLGYIHRGEALALNDLQNAAYRVQAFREKPDKPTADRYVESGRYYWNSGMFVWRCDTVLNELATHLSEAHSGLMQIADAWGTPGQAQVLEEIYPKLPRISIDYAVMEPVSQARGRAGLVVVEMPVEWLDIGSWPALAEILKMDENDNAVDCRTCMLVDSDNNIIVGHDSDHLVCSLGVSDMIIVHMPDVTMICPKSEAQRVKALVEKVKQTYGEKYH